MFGVSCELHHRCSSFQRASKSGDDFKKEWDQKFAWFTQSKECDKITTIHGEKDSMTVCGLIFVARLEQLTPSAKSAHVTWS